MYASQPLNSLKLFKIWNGFENFIGFTNWKTCKYICTDAKSVIETNPTTKIPKFTITSLVSIQTMGKYVNELYHAIAENKNGHDVTTTNGFSAFWRPHFLASKSLTVHCNQLKSSMLPLIIHKLTDNLRSWIRRCRPIFRYFSFKIWLIAIRC